MQISSRRIFKFFASIQLAIFILVSLGILSATGTIYEAMYDAQYAQKLIYHSLYMHFTLALLCINLICVIIDRWPWKRHHAGFIFAHVGIIMLIAGSLVTREYGVDGSISFDIGGSNRFLVLPEAELAVYEATGEDSFRLKKSQQLDLLVKPPKKNKYEFPLGSGVLKIDDYINFAQGDQKVEGTDRVTDGPALRIQIQNQFVNMTQWVSRNFSSPYEVFNLGPAKIILAASENAYTYSGGNEIVLIPKAESSGKNIVKYRIFTKSKGGKSKSGEIALVEALDTGWMGLQLRVLKFFNHAKQRVEFIKLDRPNGVSTSAIHFTWGEQNYWLGLNSNVRLYDKVDNHDALYIVSYRNRRLDLGFNMNLDKFALNRYQGTNRAMAYESLVSLPGLGQRKISMNNPLKYGGYTFYQASFQSDQTGQPVASILSVNKDPGRPLKYFGSLLIVLGIIIMFYFKHYRLKVFG